MIKEYIIGAGGGGGAPASPPAPVEQPDSLHSRDSVVFLDALCEGEIVGLVDGLKSVYLNDTPVQNANGTYNFTNLQLVASNGSQAGIASSILNSISADVRSETGVGTKVTQPTPVVRRISDLNVNMVDVRLSTPRMVYADSQGNQNPTTISFLIEINTNGGGYVTTVSDSFSGKTTSKYDRTYRLPLNGAGPWDIRVTRLSADSTTAQLQNDLWFDAITAIISQKLSYPNTALVALSADARAFQSIPKRTYDIKGLIVRVPSNYDPVTRLYTGIWDGAFKLAWTDNPAWCFYDLLTSERYGIGGHLPVSTVDKWGLYSIGKYCDELVPDGFGGFEPRFTLNCYISTRAEAFGVVNQLASAFRGMVYWANGSIMAVQDAPSDPVALFSRANVIDGVFSYSGASRKAMHTVALVQWNDPKNNYLPAIEYVEDAASIAVYGVIETQIAAVGCTSRGQAHRLGEWLLYSEKTEQEIVSFKSALDSSYVRPGQIFKVQDAHRSGKRLGGRLLSAGSSTTTLAIDAPVVIESGKTYTVSVVLPDGSIGSSAVSNSAGSTAMLALATALPAVPQPNALWVVAASDLSPTFWRVLAVTESAKNEYSITALAHNPSKFSMIEQGTPLQNPNTIAIPAAPDAVQSITFTEGLILDGGTVRSRLNIGWDAVQYASRYRVSWRTVPGNFAALPDSLVTHAELLDAPVGNVEIRIEAVNALGVTGVAASSTTTLLGKTAPPSDVASFFASRNGAQLFFNWMHVADLDLDHYEIRLGASWEVAQIIGVSATNSWQTSLSQGGQYLIKAVDTTGNFSRNAAACNLASNAAINVVLNDDDANYGWLGTLTSMVHDGAGLTLGYANTLNALALPLNGYPQNLMSTGGVLPAGSYSTDLHDLGKVMACSVTVAPLLDELKLGLTLDSMPLPLLNYANGWTLNGTVGGFTANYEINTSLDNIAWTGWQPFIPGLLTLRYYQIRASFTTQTGHQLRLNHFPVTVDMPDRVERYTSLAVPSGGQAVAFATPFTALDSIQVTLQNGAAGDSYTITNRTVNGFTINGFSSAGIAKEVTADIDVYGY